MPSISNGVTHTAVVWSSEEGDGLKNARGASIVEAIILASH